MDRTKKSGEIKLEIMETLWFCTKKKRHWRGEVVYRVRSLSLASLIPSFPHSRSQHMRNVKQMYNFFFFFFFPSSFTFLLLSRFLLHPCFPFTAPYSLLYPSASPFLLFFYLLLFFLSFLSFPYPSIFTLSLPSLLSVLPL